MPARSPSPNQRRSSICASILSERSESSAGHRTSACHRHRIRRCLRTAYACAVAPLPPRFATVLAAPAAALVLLSCGSSTTSDGHTITTDKPVLAGEPAGYNLGDVAFANNMITHAQQGIDMSALVPNRSADHAVVSISARIASTLRSNIAPLKVLLVQWNENPDTKTDNGRHGGGAAKGMADPATITRLDSLVGSEFDALWLRSMISREEGAIEMADEEIATGKNVDAIGLAKQIIPAQQTEISQMKQMLGAT